MEENNRSIYDDGAVLGTVEAKVHSVAEQFEDCDYMFANFAQANVELDLSEIDKPTILYVLPARGTLRLHRGYIKDIPSVQLWFICPSDFDFDGVENECRVEAMKRLGIRFIKALNDSDLFEVIDDTDLEYNVAYDAYDDNRTGVCFYPRLIEKQGILPCADVSRKPWSVL